MRLLDQWYAGLKLYRDHLPARGSISAALLILNRLQSDYDLNITKHVAEQGKAQVAGLSASALKKILAKFGETRELSSVGGRSNRGGRGDLEKFLDFMTRLHLEEEKPSARNRVLVEMQRHVVVKFVAPFFSVKRVKALFSPSARTSKFIADILEDARRNKKEGCVAEHLVGAKLALTFPEKDIRNKPCTSADEQQGFEGDFVVGTTVFHVTCSPMPELYSKLRRNVDGGRRVYLIVPAVILEYARQNVDVLMPNCAVEVEPIESFVATNIDEQVEFDGSTLGTGLRRLLEKYNERVDAVESDKSFLIDLPPNLP